MKRLAHLVALISVALATELHAGNPTNPILFATQVPIPEEVNSRDVTQSFMSVASPFSNHLADTRHAGRGGSLWIRFNDGMIVDLLTLADWSAIAANKPAANMIAVRNPNVHWIANKAIFSMTIGAPSGPTDTTQFLFQLYEITLPTQAQLAASMKPVVTKVANQPAYNNVFPTYAQGGKIIFSSDRPHNGLAHLTQREEYLGLPTVSGLWLLDPLVATSLKLLHHAPSGAFSPFVDSAGRVIFTNWDHLSRDPEAVTDSRAADPACSETFAQTTNGAGNFADESTGAAFTQVTAMPANTWDIFPEPRSFDRKGLNALMPQPGTTCGSLINGNAFNLFLPWMINLDGTGGELLNHVGRHEVGSGFTKSFLNDSNLLNFNPSAAPAAGEGNYAVHNFFNSFFAPREDPNAAGVFYGADGPDLGTHGAGRIVKLTNAGQGVNPDTMLVNYVTSSPPVPIVRGGMNQSPTGASPALNPSELYRTPVPLSDGNLIASNVSVNQSDYNTGSVASPAPVPGYLFRLRSLKALSPGAQLVNDISLTTGININTSYYVGATLVAYNGLAWELDPVEVVSRNEPGATSATPVHAITAAQFAASNVHIPTFQKYLSDNSAALSVSFDVTKRDRHDKQQPYNLRVAWSGHQTPLGAGTALGVIYDIAWQRFYQADFRRGYLLGGATPQAGRRVVATPMHTTMALNPPMANAPTGAVRIGNDGSVAAIVPAGKALSWEMLNSDAALTSQVKERFWVTFQPGEIRTCTNCHGINTADQTGALGAPSNMPAALADLLTYWKSTHASGTMQFAAAVSNAIKSAGNVFISVLRGGGSTGPVSVNYATSNGTANAGIDYAQATGTLNWLDGDTAAKTITVALLNNVAAGANKTMNVTLASPTFGALGTSTAHVLTITAPSTLDIDGNGHYDALTDGLLIMRYLLGANNAALTVAALGAVPTRSDPLLHVAPYLNDIRSLLDVDGDGSVFPHTDGVILLRYLFGLRGSALTAGISGVGSRPTAQIESYIQSLMP